MDEAEVRPIKKVSLRLRKKRGRPPKKAPRSKHRPKLTEADAVRRQRRSDWTREGRKHAFDDPSYRAYNRIQLEDLRQLHKEKPWLASRLGVPNGWTRKEARLQRLYDEAQADLLLKKMTEQGMIDPVSDNDFETVHVIVDGKPVEVKVPKTEDGMARAALRQAVIAALSPLTHGANRMGAIRTVLEWTKPKPAQTVNNNITSPEDWLKAALADNASTSNDSDGSGAASAS